MNAHTPSNSCPVTRGGDHGKWLVVDDDPLMRSVFALIVENETGAQVVQCESGEAAWSAWTEMSKIGGIVTDLDMPGMDGLELAAKVHAQDREIPIIVVTAHADKVTWEGLAASGVRQVLPKPFSCGELAAAVQESLQVTRWLAAAA
jgi:CheY-like chemotaxis protein